MPYSHDTGASDHRGRYSGVTPHEHRDDPAMVLCPACSGKSAMCDHCDRGRVTPERADIIRRVQESKETPRIG